jgi:hypothetical protein
MTNPLGAADFFALEAGECLDRLEHLVTGEAPPAGEEFLRLARVLRGSALMASQSQIARAAAGLEGLARAQRDHRRAWDAATREQVAQSVEEFRLLVRQSREWTDADTARAVRLGRALEDLTGTPHDISPPAGGARPARQELHTGVRAFVAREGALIASALDRAARSLRTSPSDREPLYNVIRRMQSLRGLAELGDLVPLPEILDGIELAVGDLTRLFAPPPGVDEVMDAAARALTRISRDVAEHGHPDPAAEESAHFTELLLRAFAVERDVVPIESLYFEADPEPLSRPLRNRNSHRRSRLGRSSWSVRASTSVRAPISSPRRAPPPSGICGSITCSEPCDRPPHPARIPSREPWASSPARLRRRSRLGWPATR